MRRFVAWFMGEGWCPSCESQLTETEAGYHSCECGVVVDYSRGGWRYARETELRRLPGMAGLPHDRERKEAA
jgi:hypothetical protein